MSIEHGTHSPDNNVDVENPSSKQIFEHLFPGCRYGDLPLYNLGNIKLITDVYTSVDTARKIRLHAALRQNMEYAELDAWPRFDKLTVAYITADLIPSDEVTRGSLLGSHSFGDLIDLTQGERLGGVAKRLISRYKYLITRMALKSGDNPYLSHLNRDITVIGVLGKDSKPKGLIYYIAGSKPGGEKVAESLIVSGSSNFFPGTVGI